MNKLACDKEQEISKAARFGDLPEELLSHTMECAICAELLLIVRYLQDEAENTRKLAFPNEKLIWKKIQLRSRGESLKRATSPIRLVESFAVLAFGVAVLWLAFSSPQLPLLRAMVEQFHLSVSTESQSWAVLAELCGALTLIFGMLGSFYLLQIEQVRNPIRRDSSS
jgi:hypothetical protein